MATMAVGAMISYMMDTLQYREGAFACSWLTLSFMDMAFIYSVATRSDAPPLMIVGLVFTMGALAALTGMWITLQFKWIHMQHPTIALVFERMVITGSLPLAAMMHTLGLAMLVEVTDVPFFLAVVLAVLYFSLGRPLVSSFHNPKAHSGPVALGGGRVSGSTNAAVLFSAVQTRVDGFLMALLTMTLPAALYATVHWTVLFHHAVHLYSMLLLASIPLLFVVMIPSGLWWLPVSSNTINFIKQVLIGAALIAALIGFEGRVVFYAFGQYIKLHPPWNWVAVTMALFGFAAVSVAHYLGLLGGAVDVTLAGTFLLLCTTAGALAAGVPFGWLPAPLVAACGLALYYDSQSLREYFVFVVGAFMTGVWFVYQHFWFLDIIVGMLHLHIVCRLVLAALVPALMVPGLVQAKASKLAISTLLMLQASLICVLEEKLYAPSHADFAGEVMYPGYLVLATSAAGIAAARQLFAAGHLSVPGAWVLHSLYAAKLVMLVLPEAYLVLPSILLALASSAPFFLYGSGEQPHGGKRRVRLQPWQGILNALCVVVTVGLARFAIFDVVQFLLSSRPTEGILLGALVLALAAGLAPLVLHCYPGNIMIGRLLGMLVMTGLMLLLLQPPLPLAGGARCPKLPLSLCPRLWDERHVPMHDAEDVEVWGRGLSRKEHWPRWLLLAATVLGMGATAVGGAFAKSVFGRLVIALTTGVLIGGYVALEVVPQEGVLQVLVMISCILVVAFVVLLQLPVARTPLMLPGLFVAWLVVFGLTMLLQAELPLPEPSAEMKRLFPDSKIEVEGEVMRAMRASLMGVFAGQSLLLAFTLKLRMSAALRQQESKLVSDGHDEALYMRGGIPMSDLFCGVVPAQVFSRFGCMLKLPGAAGVALQRLNRDGLVWVPTVGNICTGLALLMGITLNVHLTGGAAEAIFMLAPLLLLLSQDPVLLPGLGDKQRYFPPVLAVTAFLMICSIGQSFPDGGPVLAPAEPLAFAIKNIVLAALTLPNHVLFLIYLWTQKPRSSMTLLAWAPLNALPLILADIPPVKYLALLALAMALTQHFSMMHVRNVGMKLI